MPMTVQPWWYMNHNANTPKMVPKTAEMIIVVVDAMFACALTVLRESARRFVVIYGMDGNDFTL